MSLSFPEEANEADFSFSDLGCDFEDSEIQSQVAREQCPHCERPKRVCWCPHVPQPPLEIASRILILQHPNERKRNIRTALMAARGVAYGRCAIYPGRRFPGKHAPLHELLASPKTYLLYPGKHAVPMGSLKGGEGPFNFVILDGTWEEARKLYARNPALQALRQVSLEVDAVSAYVVRTQPADYCLSTVETVAATLAAVEGWSGEAWERLVRPLHAMCNVQINHGAVGHDSKEYKEQNSQFNKANNWKRKAKGIVGASDVS